MKMPNYWLLRELCRREKQHDTYLSNYTQWTLDQFLKIAPTSQYQERTCPCHMLQSFHSPFSRAPVWLSQHQKRIMGFNEAWEITIALSVCELTKSKLHSSQLSAVYGSCQYRVRRQQGIHCGLKVAGIMYVTQPSTQRSHNNTVCQAASQLSVFIGQLIHHFISGTLTISYQPYGC